MDLIVFSKSLRERSVPELAALAREHGFDGYDLCIREGHPVNPQNVTEALPEATRVLREAGLTVPLVTAEGGLTSVEDPTAEPILAAMAEAGVGLIKLGYFHFNAKEQDYWGEVARVREALAGWGELAARQGVKVLYHTHSGGFMGLNAGAIMHLLEGLDPAHLGAYLDSGHLLVEGERWPMAVAMTQRYLSAVALKDSGLRRGVRAGHGQGVAEWVPAGQGMVDWTGMLEELQRVGFEGPLSIHCEYEVPEEEREGAFGREVRFFREMVGRD